uniref:Uncharacterized protein n=1 Tax=Corvus moneduloides TaxID=1196302 RepID=A0A8U7NTH3_CORMO
CWGPFLSTFSREPVSLWGLFGESPTPSPLGWCPLSPAGAQTTQLLVEPPWTPPVLWDRVTLTCQGLGTAAATTWYKDGQRWWQKGPNRFVVTKSGTYQCDRSSTGLSPPICSTVAATAVGAGWTLGRHCGGRSRLL